MQVFYEYINGADMLEFLKDFLTHEDPNVRAKACSAIGNMCRHSFYFYSSLVSKKATLFHNILNHIKYSSFLDFSLFLEQFSFFFILKLVKMLN